MKTKHFSATVGSRTRSGRKAYALVVVLSVSTVTSIVLLGTLRAVSLEATAQVNTVDADRAAYLAQAAIQHGLAIVEDNPNWTGSLKNVPFSKNSQATYTVTISEQDGKTVVRGISNVDGMIGDQTVAIEKEKPADEKERPSKKKGKKKRNNTGKKKGKRK